MPICDADIRAALDRELLSRPPLDVSPPARVIHQAFLTPRAGSNGDTGQSAEMIAPLLRALTLDPAGEDARHVIRPLAGGMLKWERHGEFETLTIIETAPRADTDDLYSAQIAPLLEAMPLPKRIAACRVTTQPIMDMVKTGGEPSASSAAKLIGEDALVFISYPPDSNGFTAMTLYLKPMRPDRAGRLVQRLLEIETYRYMAMLSFPLAREIQAELAHANLALDQRIADLHSGQDTIGEHASNEAMLADIQALIQRTAAQKTRTSFRFGATRAYAAIVQKRLAELREERIEGFPRLSTFLARRMQPAIDFCAAMEGQQSALDDRLGQAAQILRTRVELGLAHQNQTLLARLEASAKVQIRTQRSVEGFSVVAISYYLVSLIAIFLKGGDKAGWFSGWEIYEAILAPIAILLVVWRLRHAIRTSETEAKAD